MMTEQAMAMPPYKIAFILDGEVVDVLHTDPRLAAIMLSEPLILDVTDTYGDGLVQVGSTFNKDGSFTPPPPLDFTVDDGTFTQID